MVAAFSIIFDPENPKFKCFFEKIHVTTATKWIFYFYFLSALLFVPLLALSDLKFSWILFFALLIGFGIDVFIFGSGLYAVKYEQPKWLIPYFIVCTIGTIFDGCIICFGLIKKDYKGAWILFDIVNFIVGIWFIFIVYRCYQFLTEKKQSNGLPMSFSNKNIVFVLEENV